MLRDLGGQLVQVFERRTQTSREVKWTCPRFLTMREDCVLNIRILFQLIFCVAEPAFFFRVLVFIRVPSPHISHCFPHWIYRSISGPVHWVLQNLLQAGNPPTRPLLGLIPWLLIYSSAPASLVLHQRHWYLFSRVPCTTPSSSLNASSGSWKPARQGLSSETQAVPGGVNDLVSSPSIRKF